MEHERRPRTEHDKLKQAVSYAQQAFDEKQRATSRSRCACFELDEKLKMLACGDVVTRNARAKNNEEMMRLSCEMNLQRSRISYLRLVLEMAQQEVRELNDLVKLARSIVARRCNNANEVAEEATCAANTCGELRRNLELYKYHPWGDDKVKATAQTMAEQCEWNISTTDLKHRHALENLHTERGSYEESITYLSKTRERLARTEKNLNQTSLELSTALDEMKTLEQAVVKAREDASSFETELQNTSARKEDTEKRLCAAGQDRDTKITEMNEAQFVLYEAKREERTAREGMEKVDALLLELHEARRQVSEEEAAYASEIFGYVILYVHCLTDPPLQMRTVDKLEEAKKLVDLFIDVEVDSEDTIRSVVLRTFGEALDVIQFERFVSTYASARENILKKEIYLELLTITQRNTSSIDPAAVEAARRRIDEATEQSELVLSGIIDELLTLHTPEHLSTPVSDGEDDESQLWDTESSSSSPRVNLNTGMGLQQGESQQEGSQQEGSQREGSQREGSTWGHSPFLASCSSPFRDPDRSSVDRDTEPDAKVEQEGKAESESETELPAAKTKTITGKRVRVDDGSNNTRSRKISRSDK
jgi:hypothetical protein